MTGKDIPSLTDEGWYNQQELGQVERVLTYSTGDGKSQVKVKAHVLSGAVSESLEAKHTKFNKQTGEFDLDSEAYLKDIVKQVFRLDENKYRAIMGNKSSDLRTKLRDLATEIIGLAMGEEEIEHEKNLESPEASSTSLME